MRRSRIAQSTAGALLLVTAMYAVVSACSFDINDPCYSDPQAIQKRGQLDGIWAITSVNGQPPNGFDLPATEDNLVSGSIDFKTRKIEGKCDDLERSAGYAIAQVTLRAPNGSTKVKGYTGWFVYDHATNELKITAAGYTIEGIVAGNSLALQSPPSVFGSATVILRR